MEIKGFVLNNNFDLSIQAHQIQTMLKVSYGIFLVWPWKTVVCVYACVSERKR